MPYHISLSYRTYMTQFFNPLILNYLSLWHSPLTDSSWTQVLESLPEWCVGKYLPTSITIGISDYKRLIPDGKHSIHSQVSYVLPFFFNSTWYNRNHIFYFKNSSTAENHYPKKCLPNSLFQLTQTSGHSTLNHITILKKF